MFRPNDLSCASASAIFTPVALRIRSTPLASNKSEALWHSSKELLSYVEEHNNKHVVSPRIELVPLPASAQFLNVIASVFSGMARAIIHNSDYPSVKAACEAIDRFFQERNHHYAENPRQAGRKIWGMERSEVRFNPANNCKDLMYR